MEITDNLPEYAQKNIRWNVKKEEPQPGEEQSEQVQSQSTNP